VRYGCPVLDNVRDKISTKIVPRLLINCVAPELIEKECSRKHIDAHAGKCVIRLVRHTWGILGLLKEGGDAIGGIHSHDTEAGGLQAWNFETADSHVRAGLDMLPQHQFVIHLVDMVAGENDNVLRAVARDDVYVLKDRIGGPDIPLCLGGALARRQYIEAFISLRKFQPCCMWRIKLCALYWVATLMWRMPELSAFESAKSMIRDLPPKNTAGFARLSVSSINREPRPPASTQTMVWRARWSWHWPC
jgi:hypothetical protein